MERFVSGQKVRVLTVNELLKKGYKIDEDGDIYVGEDDEFFILDFMADASNTIHTISDSEEIHQRFIMKTFSYTPRMCEEVKEEKKINRGFEIVKDDFRKHPDVDIQLPTRGSKVSAGYDFYLPCDITLQPNEKTCVWSDVKAYMNEGEVLMLHVRSSIGIKKGLMLSNITGVIDADFYNNPSSDGNIGIALYNYSDKTVELKRGERICQGVFIPFLVADNGNTDKERVGGIGSTGSK